MTAEDLEKQSLIDQIEQQQAELARIQANIDRMMRRLQQLDNGVDKGV